MTIKDLFAERLRLLRGERGLSQIELATAAGIAPAQLSRYELGKAYPRAEILAKLANVLGVERHELALRPESALALNLPADLISKLADAASRRLGGQPATRDDISYEVRIRLEESLGASPVAKEPSTLALETMVNSFLKRTHDRLDEMLLDEFLDDTGDVKRRLRKALVKSIRTHREDDQQANVERTNEPVLVRPIQGGETALTKHMATIVENVNRPRTPTIPGFNAPKEGLGAAPKAGKPKKEKPVITKKKVYDKEADSEPMKFDHTTKGEDK